MAPDIFDEVVAIEVWLPLGGPLLLRTTEGEAWGEGDEPFFEVMVLVVEATWSLLEAGGERTERLLHTDTFGEEARDEFRDDDLSEKKKM